MKNLTAPCGLDCSKCGAYIAKQTNDDDVRKKTAEQWSKEHSVNIEPKDINCDGCLAENGQFGYCNVCEIRLCSLNKQIKDCKTCKDYKCEKFSVFG
jgi:hypothetical protein